MSIAEFDADDEFLNRNQRLGHTVETDNRDQRIGLIFGNCQNLAYGTVFRIVTRCRISALGGILGRATTRFRCCSRGDRPVTGMMRMVMTGTSTTGGIYRSINRTGHTLSQMNQFTKQRYAEVNGQQRPCEKSSRVAHESECNAIETRLPVLLASNYL